MIGHLPADRQQAVVDHRCCCPVCVATSLCRAFRQLEAGRTEVAGDIIRSVVTELVRGAVWVHGPDGYDRPMCMADPRHDIAAQLLDQGVELVELEGAERAP